MATNSNESHLDRLLTELLTAVCDWVRLGHPPSLLSFALVSKRCFSIACVSLYQTLVFKVRDPEQLARDAQRFEQLLRRDSALGHVRRLVVLGGLRNPRLQNPRSDIETVLSCSGLSGPVKRHIERMPCAKPIESPYDHDDARLLKMFVPTILQCEQNSGEYYNTLKEAHETDGLWPSLCRLVALLPGLTDLVWASWAYFPSCVNLGTTRDGPRRPVPKRVLINVLIDSAVDENLALAIFDAISRGKRQPAQGISAVPLETLSLSVVGGSWVAPKPSVVRFMPRSSLRPFLSYLARAWRITRDPRDDRRGVLHAIEVGRERPLKKDADLAKHLGLENDNPVLSCFRQIWPETGERGDRREEWESRPFERLGDEDE